MAAVPPAIDNSNGSIVNAATPPAQPTTLAATLGYRTDTPPKSQRGHNKPKCKQCGNVARSRCPFESCKSCCSINQNPCLIHVFKANSTIPDKSPSSSAAPLEQRSSEPSPSSNAALLEEVLSVESPEDNASSASVPNPASMGNNEMTILWLKLLLRSNSTRSDSVRNRIRQIVDKGLQKLQKCDVKGDVEEPNEASKRPKSLRTERLSDIRDLIDKINKARSKEDLKSCLEMKSQLFNLDKGSSKPEVEEKETHKQFVEGDLAAAKELDYSFPKLIVAGETDQETLNTIHRHFCSLDHVEQL